jgi:hypothetical protein
VKTPFEDLNISGGELLRIEYHVAVSWDSEPEIQSFHRWALLQPRLMVKNFVIIIAM